MTLRNEIGPYLDGNKLVTPGKATPGEKRGSDNGTCFLSEYYILLKRNKELLPLYDCAHFETAISNCMVDDVLHRAPGDLSDDVTDNYHSVLAACYQLGNTAIPRAILGHPWQLIRIHQPQLIAMAWSACGFPPILAFPFYVYAALAIAISCIGADPGDADSRRLAWLLIQGTENSFMCRLAAKLWFRRLFKVFPGGMQDVNRLYYNPKGPLPAEQHPLITYMDFGN